CTARQQARQPTPTVEGGDMSRGEHPLSLTQPLVLRAGTGDGGRPRSGADGAPDPVVRRFVDGPSAAEYLCMSPRTLEKYRVSGAGPRFRRFGRRIVYSIEELDLWADEQPTFRSTS